MIVKKAWIPGHGTYSIGSTNQLINPTEGDVTFLKIQPKEYDEETEKVGAEIDSQKAPQDYEGLRHYLDVASLANLATVQKVNDEWQARGDPTEIAIQVFTSRFN